VTVRCGRYASRHVTDHVTSHVTTPLSSTPATAYMPEAKNLPFMGWNPIEANYHTTPMTHPASMTNWKWGQTNAEEIKTTMMYSKVDGEDTPSDWAEGTKPRYVPLPDKLETRYRGGGAALDLETHYRRSEHNPEAKHLEAGRNVNKNQHDAAVNVERATVNVERTRDHISTWHDSIGEYSKDQNNYRSTVKIDKEVKENVDARFGAANGELAPTSGRQLPLLVDNVGNTMDTNGDVRTNFKTSED